MANMLIGSPPVTTLADLRGHRGRRRREAIVRGIFRGCAILSIVISALIILSLIRDAVSFVTTIDLSQLFANGWFPRRGQFGISTLIAGTFLVAGVAMLVAAPLGLGAAIYLSEYANPRVRRSLKPIVELLASIPSVVMGFFALTVISPNLIQKLFSDASLFNMAAAGIGVGVLVTPLVASVAEDALYAVPGAMRETSYGLGAKKMSTSLRNAFPAALSGVVASRTLATPSRAG